VRERHRGDRFSIARKITKPDHLFSTKCEGLRRELGLKDAEASATRRNLLVSGTELNDLVGAEFEIQGVRFAGVEQCKPCYWMDSALGLGAEAWLEGRGGLRARILTNGVLRCSRSALQATLISTLALVGAHFLPKLDAACTCPHGKMRHLSTIIFESKIYSKIRLRVSSTALRLQTLCCSGGDHSSGLAQYLHETIFFLRTRVHAGYSQLVDIFGERKQFIISDKRNPPCGRTGYCGPATYSWAVGNRLSQWTSELFEDETCGRLRLPISLF
jgi:hypothetical protein